MSRWRAISQAEVRRVWLDQSLTSQQAADRLGLARVSLQRRASAMGLPARKNGRRDTITDPNFAKMWMAGVMIHEIAGYYDCHVDTPRKTAARLGLPERGRCGPQLTLTAFAEMQLAAALSRTAQVEQQQMILAEMVDKTSNGRFVGAEKAKAA